MVVKPYAADYDGDALAIYRIHSQKAINEMYDNAFLLNTLKYDHNNQFLHSLMNEAKYCFRILIEAKYDNPFNSTKIKNLETLTIDYDKKLTDCYIINNNHITSYGMCLVNKFAGFNNITINADDGPEQVSEKIYMDSENNTEYHKRLNKLNNYLNWFLTVYSDETLTLPFVEAAKEISKTRRGNDLIQSLPDNPYIGNTIFNALIDKSYDKMDPTKKLFKLQKGKFNKKQFARSVVGIGYISDDTNIIQDSPIVGTLLGGLTEDQFFETSFGTRKGIVDKQSVVPKAGYMERSMVMNLSPIEIIEEDCNVKYGFNIVIQNKKHGDSLVHRWFFTADGKQELFTGEMVNDSIGKTYNFRSSISCQTPNMRICKRCFGQYDNVKSPFVGILAGQYLAEKLTQLAMSSFHTSGSATLPVDKKLKEFIKVHLTDIEQDKLNDSFMLYFDKDLTEELMTTLSEIPGYANLTARKVIFNNLYNVENNDVTAVIKAVNQLLNTENEKEVLPPNETYAKLIDYIINVGFVYSSFVEAVLANCYVNKNGVVLRYAYADPSENNKIHKKYSIKKIHTLIDSGILSFLYEPNNQSLTKTYDKFDKIDMDKITIFEKIWMGKV